MDPHFDALYVRLLAGIHTHVLGKTTDSYDILNMANIHAAFSSAQYYNAHMHKANNFDNDLALLTHAVGIRPVHGQILEFGVASGRTINHISSLVTGQVYGFDVFTGLPETWRTGFAQGEFKTDTLPSVNPNMSLVIGLFEDTLEDFLRTHTDVVSLLHIDCDLYSATSTVFAKLGHLIQPGTVIVFDEYFNYPGWQQHEFKAFQEFVERRNIRYRYDSFVSRHQQVCVVIL